MMKISAPPAQNRQFTASSTRWWNAMALPSLKPPTSTSEARTRYRPASPKAIAVSTSRNARLIDGDALVSDAGVQAGLLSVRASDTPGLSNRHGGHRGDASLNGVCRGHGGDDHRSRRHLGAVSDLQMRLDEDAHPEADAITDAHET